MWIFTFIFVFLLMFKFLLPYIRKVMLMNKIPGNRGLPLVGPLFQFNGSPEMFFKKLRQMYKFYGGITSLYTLTRASIHIYDPEDIEVILSSTRFNDKHNPYTFLRPWLGDGLLTSNGQIWHNRRKMLLPAFHLNVLRDYMQIFIAQTERFLKEVEMETQQEKTSLMPLIRKTTLNIMCDISMGISNDQKKTHETDCISKYMSAVNTAGKCIVERICKIWYSFDVIYRFTTTAKIEKQALKTLHKFSDAIIKERKKSIQDKEILSLNQHTQMKSVPFLDLLLYNESVGKMDIKSVTEEVDNLMFAGHDTSAVALAFCMMRIANEPQIQEKIYEEQNNIFGDSERQPTMEDLSEMRYLECCMKESLRLHPSVPTVSRYLTEEVELSGYKIPAGVICNIQIFDLHQRGDIYPEPEKFIPERFLPENALKRHRYSYIPFSAGPRSCIGQKFSFLEMKVILSGLLRRFVLEPMSKPEDMVYSVHLVLRVSNPIYVRFRHRRPAEASANLAAKLSSK